MFVHVKLISPINHLYLFPMGKKKLFFFKFFYWFIYLLVEALFFFLLRNRWDHYLALHFFIVDDVMGKKKIIHAKRVND